MIVLGLTGHAGSGKDTVADYLVRRYGFIKFAFSDALYAEVQEAFGLESQELLRNRETKDTPTAVLSPENCSDSEFLDVLVACEYVSGGNQPLSPRQVLQWWGTEYRRAQDPDYWVKQADAFVKELRGMYPYPELRPDRFVNTAVRFENERNWVTTCMAGNVWHLTRPGAPAVHAHVSEEPLLIRETERRIVNGGTIYDLHQAVELLLSTPAKFVRCEPMAPDVEPIETDGLPQAE